MSSAYRVFTRRLKGALTALGLARAGYYIPYRYAADVPPLPQDQPAYPALAACFEAARPAIEAHLDTIDRYEAALAAIGADDEPPEPRWGQDWFPCLDAAASYAMIRSRQPRRIVEIGSGHSTRFMVRAVRDEGLNTEITAIDPAPRADLSRLGGVTLVPRVVQKADAGIFKALGPGDILSIDSSHILMPGSDVDLLLNGVLPVLPDSVLVHIHDIFLPWDYPARWAWRSYNEQSGVGTLIAGDWQVLFSSVFARRMLAERVSSGIVGRLPLRPGAVETSLWLRKGSQP